MIDLARLRELGVVGAGGAGFPAYQKLASPAEVVILNAAECEPLLHKDAEILESQGIAVLAALGEIRAKVGARRCLVAIKQKHAELIARLRVEAEPLGIAIHELGDFYPAGDEFVTVYETTGRVVPPGGIPLDVGCLVTNVETVLNVALDRPVTRKHLTVCGAVPRPMTVSPPVGISFGEVLRTVGVEPGSVAHLLVGGVMMGRLAAGLDEVVTRTTGALVCLPEGHRLGERYRADAAARDRIGRSACDQCSFCTEMCPRYLLGHPVEPHLAMRGLGFNRIGDAPVLASQFCCECNLCSLYACPEDLFPKDACADNKRTLRARGLDHPWKGRQDLPVHSMQAYRHIPVSSLMKKLGLTAFEDVGPLTDLDWKPASVRVPLKQHVGQPAVARVRVGERVREGQTIGDAPEGLGVAVHASIEGTVTEVGDRVAIRRVDA